MNTCAACGEQSAWQERCPHCWHPYEQEPLQVEVPQLQGERICFREWRVGEDLGLYSTGVGERWEREMVADSSRCRERVNPFVENPGASHERSPDPDCDHCGLHAFYDVPDLLQYANSDTGLAGAVVVSGRTMLGPTGVRAEKARVVLLAYANDRQKALADAASRKLGVGCCALADLERLALEYGQPVPDDEKPEVAGGEFFTFGPATAIIGNNFVGPAAIRQIGRGRRVTLSGGGGAAIKNLSVGVSSSGEVAVRVDGQEWIPAPDPQREKLAKNYRDDKITLPIVVLVALFCLATIPFGGGWLVVVIGLVWSLCAVGGAVCTKEDRQKLREYDAAKESS